MRKRKRKVKFNAKKFIRNLFILAVLVGALFYGAILYGNPIEPPPPPLVNETDYPELKAWADIKGINADQITSVKILPRNLTGNQAMLGSVLYFEFIYDITDEEGNVTTYKADNVEILSHEGLNVIRDNVLVMSQTGTYPVTLGFEDYTETVNFEILPPSDYSDKLLLINKISRVPSDYVAGELTTNPGINYVYSRGEEVTYMEVEATAALYSMFAAADDAGYYLYALSGHRSYETQEYLYNRAGGDAQNDTAAPGASEHQSGLTMDITWGSRYFSLFQEMEDSEEFEWLSEHCYEYGFILRYPYGYEDITGYVYEPWHYRYIGVDNAIKYRDGNYQTLEEFAAQPR